MIEAVALTKFFGAVQAVSNITFTVAKGEVVGLLGPNGAGKTTTFRMIAGTLGPTSGEVRLASKSLTCEPILAKRALGYMPENAPLYPELTGMEYLQYRAALKGIPRHQRRIQVSSAAAKAHVSAMLGVRISHLSKGYRQRVALADALLGNPQVLLLDEPTAGLDPNQVMEVRDLILRLKQEHAILLSTHILSEVEAVCSRAIVIHRGRIVGEGTLSELHALSKSPRVRVVLALSRADLDAALATLPAALGNPIVSEGPSGEWGASWVVSLPHQGGASLSQAIAYFCAQGVIVLEAAPDRAELADVFSELTGGRPAIGQRSDS